MTRRRLLRRARRLAFAAFLLGIVGLLVVARSGVAARWALPALGEALGLDIDASGLVLAGDGSLILSDVRLRLRDWDGPPEAGELGVVRRLEVAVDWPALLGGGDAPIRRLTLEGPLLRLSRDTDTGAMNASALLEVESGGGRGALPEVVAEAGRLEIGEHGPAGYAPLATLPVQGLLTPSDSADAERYVFRLRGDAGDGFAAAEAHGEIDGNRLVAALTGVTLDDLPPDALPGAALRERYRRLGLVGRVTPRRVEIGEGGSVFVALRLDGVALSLPFTADGRVAEAQDETLRLRGVEGDLTLTESGLSADLLGEAEGLTYRARLDAFGLSAAAPFVARLETRPFRLLPGAPLLRFVPPVVAEKLALFPGVTGEIEATVWLARGPLAEGTGAGVRRATGSHPLPAGLLAQLATTEENGGDTPTENETEPETKTANRADEDAADTPATELATEGAVVIRDATAAYRSFPYPFERMSGRFEFTRDTLRLLDITGEGAEGGRLVANGEIGPLGDTAAVDLRITIEQLPIGEGVREAVGDQRRPILESLFSPRAYRELIEEGYLHDPARVAEIRRRLAAIEAELRAWAARVGVDRAELAALREEERRLRVELASKPAFTLAGKAETELTIRRLEGEEGIWTQRIDVRLDEAGLVSSVFPMPILGRDMRLLIDDGIATLSEGTYTTLAGGRATIDVVADLTAPPGHIPTVTIAAHDIPIQPMLIRALPGPARDETTAAGPAAPGTLRRTLESLRLTGTLDSLVDVGPGPDGGLFYTIDTTLAGVSADPLPLPPAGSPIPGEIASAGLGLRDVGGNVFVEPDIIVADLDGRLVGTAGDGRVEPTMLYATAELRLPPGASWNDEPPPEPAVWLAAAAEGLDVGLPAEPLVAVFDADAAQRLRDYRDATDPAGRLDLAVELDSPAARPHAATLRISASAFDALALNALGGRLRIEGRRGRGVYDAGAASAVEFDALEVDIAFAGEGEDDSFAPAGTLTLDGVLPLDATAPGRPAADLALRLADAAFEGPLARSLVRDRIGGGLAELYDRTLPAGRFDLRLDARESPAGTRVGDLPPLVFDAELRPASLEATALSGRLVLPRVEGVIAFDRWGGSFEAVRASGEGFEVTGIGGWLLREGGGYRIDATLLAEADGLPTPLLPALPEELATLLQDLAFGAERSVRLDGMSLLVDRRADDPSDPSAATAATEPAVRTRGDLAISGGRLQLGVPVTEIDGRIGFDAWRSDSGVVGYSVALDASRLRVSGLRMTEATGELLSGARDGETLVPTFSARAHGGRVTASARLAPEADGTLRYLLDARFAGVRLAPALEDLAAATPISAGADDLAAADWDRREDLSRGRFDAELTLSAPLGEGPHPAGATYGRGRAVASGGPVVVLPLLTPLIEFSNLQLPVGDELGRAHASFYILDDELTFERLGVTSDSVELLGFGSMSWPDRELNLRVRSTAANPIPLLSDLIESVRDGLILTKITGKLEDPRITTEQLPGAARLVDGLLGRQENPQARRLREIEAEAHALREQSRTLGPTVGRSGRVRLSPRRETPGTSASGERTDGLSAESNADGAR